MTHPADSKTPYANLSPDLVLDAVEAMDLMTDGRLLALNSFENRVYQIGLEDAQPIVAKFYRPGRWTNAQIHEEHQFSFELKNQDIPVVAPMKIEGDSLLEYQDFRFALFPRQGGREPVLESADNLEWLGRLLGRIHSIGNHYGFQHRHQLIDWSRIVGSAEIVVELDFVPNAILGRYRETTESLITLIQQRFESVPELEQHPIHGDCHRGNVLWTDDGPHFVDLDDCCVGPAVQDFWMLLDGEAEQRQIQMDHLLTGYEQFMDFDQRQLKLIEALKAIRMIEYAAWIARRWHDPAFPRSFPWFAEPRFWEEHLTSLTQQKAALLEQPTTMWS